MSKKKNIVMITMLAVVAVMSIAYAYFATNLNITSTGSISSSWDVKFINITNDTPVGSATNVVTPSYTATTATMSADLKLPGDSITYRITLKNNGDIPAIIEDIDASATGSGAIIFSLTGLNIGEKLAGGAEKEIVVKIEYDPLTTSQPVETTKTLTVSIKAVQDTGQSIDEETPSIDQNFDYLSTAILNNNILLNGDSIDYSDPIMFSGKVYEEVHGTTEVAAYTGTVYDLPLCSSYTFDSGTGTYYPENCPHLPYDQTIAEYVAQYGDIGNNVYTCGEKTTECTSMYKLTGSDGYAYVYTSKEKDGINTGIYYTSTNTEDDKTTYFFRGNVLNNYVKLDGVTFEHSVEGTCTYNGEQVYYNTTFSSVTGNEEDKATNTECTSTNVCDYKVMDEHYFYIVGLSEEDCTIGSNGGYESGTYLDEKATFEAEPGSFVESLWRIVRINEDGSIRIVTQDSVGTSNFNISSDDNAYVGYMYGTPGSSTYALTHSNDNPSAVKTFLDNWYVNNLSNYSNYLTDAGFCNDRSIAPSAGLWYSSDTALGYGQNYTIYGAYNRVYKTKTPQFECPNASNDLFTTSSSIKGNKALTYPIGLLTWDEVYAGGVNGNKNAYLINGSGYRTMTPYNFNTSGNVKRAFVFVVESDGYVNGWLPNDEPDGVRPVVNLKSNVTFTLEGTGVPGTATNPYIIKTN